MSILDDARGHLSQELAFEAERLVKSGEHDLARRRFAEAAALEAQVARDVPEKDTRLRSVLAISAVALWFKSRQYEKARQVAYVFLADPDSLTAQGRRDLEALVERCMNEATAFEEDDEQRASLEQEVEQRMATLPSSQRRPRLRHQRSIHKAYLEQVEQSMRNLDRDAA